MGRIRGEMMYKKLLIVVMLCLVLMTSFVFADIPDIPSISELALYDYVIIFECLNGIQVHSCESPFFVTACGDGITCIAGDNCNGYKLQGNNWSLLFDKIKGSNFTIGVDNTTEMLYSNHDVMWGDDVFFSGPLGPTRVEMAIMGLSKVLVGQMRTILPVGFGVLSVVLLIMLLGHYFKRFLYRLTS